jgi:methylated-DNA-[protein]-cysteine S-methyltransferase
MDAIGFKVFPISIGECAIVWSELGVCGFHLPQVGPERLRIRIAQRFAAARECEPPPEVQAAIDGVVALLDGAPADLSAVPLDLERVPAFDRRVYAVARAIPPGRTLTYGELAERLGDPLLARAVGQALGSNPIAVIVPCHRVLAAGGRPGGFSAGGGVSTKLRILLIERAQFGHEPGLF